jgi:hypothetical protein
MRRELLLFAFSFLAMVFVEGRASAKNIDTIVDVFGQKISLTLEPMDHVGKPLSSFVANRLMRLQISFARLKDAKPLDIKLLQFNASMPSHQHGMVTKPNISSISVGRYQIDGVKFHMPGQWTIDLKLEQSGQAAQVAIPLKL